MSRDGRTTTSCLPSPLQMYRFVVSHFDGIFDTFADGWVRMDTVQYLVEGCFQFTGNNCFGDHFGYVVADHVRTQPLAVLGIEDHFYKSFGGTGCRSLTRGAERELSNLHF